MRVLVISRFLPHAAFRGSGGQDLYHYILALSQKHRLSLIGFQAEDDPGAMAAMRQVCAEVVAVGYRPGRLRARIGRSLWRLALPAVFARNLSLPFLLALRRLVRRQRFDAVLVDGTMAPYAWRLGGVHRVIDEVDVYGDVAHEWYLQQSGWLKRSLAWWEWRRTQWLERSLLARYDGAMVRSIKDGQRLQQMLPELRVEVVSPWFEGLGPLQQISSERPPGNQLLFMGAMRNQKNEEAALYFARQVLPLIRAQVPDVALSIVGAGPTPKVMALHDPPYIDVVGEVPDLTPYYARAAVNVVPLLVGGGIIVKALNGLAAARPTVCTPSGNAGTGAVPGEHLIVTGPQPETFAAAVVRLLLDQEEWASLAANGRQFVLAHYDWDASMRRLQTLLSPIGPSETGD